MLKDFLERAKGQRDTLPNSFTIELGELIRKARVEAKLSQGELAEAAYVNQAAVSLIEKGKRSITVEEIVYLSIALNKPISYFFSGPKLRQINQGELTVLEEELLLQAKKLDTDDLKRIIAQIKALVNLNG